MAPVAIIGGVAFAQKGMVSMVGGTQNNTQKSADVAQKNSGAQVRANSLTEKDWAFIRSADTKDIASRYNCSLRTAQDWKQKATARKQGQTGDKGQSEGVGG